MKYYGWLSVSATGFATTLCINGQALTGLLVGLAFVLYCLLKYRLFINGWMILVSVMASLVYIMVCHYTQLLSVVPVLFYMSIVNGINTGLFMEIIRHKRVEGFNQVQKAINLYASCLLCFVIVIVIGPSAILNMFLYPYYIMGGAKEAMLAIVMMIFSPYIFISKCLVLYRYSQGSGKLHLVSK